MVQFAASSLSTESSAQWDANKWDILDPLSETNNSSISLCLITFMIPLMVNVARVTSTMDPKSVRSRMTRGHFIFSVALHPFSFNFMSFLVVFVSWDSVTLGNNFWIYTRALYFHHSLCLFCMVLPCCYCLCTFLIWQLALNSFC